MRTSFSAVAGIDTMRQSSPMLRPLAYRRLLLQVGTVVITTVAFELLTDAIRFRSPVNLLWMVGLPVAVAHFSNEGWERRGVLSLVLIGVSLLTGMVVGVNFTSYG